MMKDTLKKLKRKKYSASILLIVLVVFVIGLISILKPVIKNIKIDKVLTKTSSLNASVIDGISEGVQSNNYDQIKYQIKVNKDSSDTAVIIATLSEQESKYARFKEIKNSVVSDNGKKITVTTTNEKTNLIVDVMNAPYGTVIKPTIKINSEDENKSNIPIEPVTITGKSVEGHVSSEDGVLYNGLEIALIKNNEQVKTTYTKEDGDYVFSLGDTDNYQVNLNETKYKIVRYEEETTDSNRRILNLVIKEAEPFKVNIKKTISKLDLVVNGVKHTYDYDDETKVVRSMKNAKTIEGSIYYSITIKNTGEIKGTLTSLKDVIPEGLSFDESKNPGWTKDGKYLFYTPLEGKEIDSFENKNVSLVLDIVKTNEARTYINTAISTGDDYKYIVYYLNNKVYKEEYVINSEKLENINPGVENFDGWYTDRNYTNKYNFKTPVTKDTILFGKIKNNKYNVTFIDINPNNNQETVLDIVEVNEGENIELVNHPDYRGYTFNCFKLNNSCYKDDEILEDTTIYTSYKANNYEIEYDLDGGVLSDSNPDRYTVNDEFTLNNPSKEGFTFIGWSGTDLSEDTINVTIPRGSIGDREYTANYEINKSTLTINPNGGTYLDNSSEVSYTENYGTIKQIEDSVRRGYTFINYSHTGGGIFNNGTFTFDNDDSELTAEYEIINYTIEYNNITNDEKTALNNPTEYNVETDTFTLREPSTRVDAQGNPSEDFIGWDDGNGNVSKNVSIEKGNIGNKTYTAVWRENGKEYAITYELNGGTLSSSNPSTYTRATNTFTLNNPSKEGYTFIGWSGTDLIGNTNQLVTIPKGSAGDRHYVANYEIIPYSITYNGLTNNELSTLNNPTTYNIETNTITLVNPSRPGYTFLGWSGTGINDKSLSVSIPKGSTGNREYTANFEVIEYSLTYTLNGGTVSSTNPDKYTIESNNITLNNPSKEGYNFIGWTGTDVDTPTLTVTIPTGSMGHRSYLANYEPIVYNITYDYGDGVLPSGVTNPSTYTIESDEIIFNNPVKEGHVFTNYTFNGDIVTSIPTGSNGDKHLVAHYDIKKINVKYYNESVLYHTDEIDWNTVTTAPSINPTKPHNIFLYWSEDETNEYDFSTNIVSDKNLYAIYEEVEAPTITINPELDDTTNRTWVCGDSANADCGVTVTINSTHNDYELYYKVGDGEAHLYTEPFKVYENTTITAFAKKSNIYSEESNYEIENVDRIAPTINQPSTGAMSFNMTVSGTSQDAGSGVKKITVYLKEKTALDYDDTNKCETEVFDGKKDQAENYSCSFTGIKDSTEYTVKIVAEDYVGNLSELEVEVTTHPYIARVVGKNGMLWYTVDPDTKEFIIEDGKEFLLFDSIQNAVDYCAEIQCTIQTNPTIPVVNESVTVGENQDITIDLDGRGINSDSSATFINNGKLQIVDRNPRMIDTEHDSIGFVRNTVGKAIINNNIFVLGEGSPEASEEFIYPELDRPLIEAKTNAIEQNNKFYFFDGKLISEDTVMLDHGDDAITQYSYNVIFTGENDKNIGTLDRTTDPEAKIKSTYYAKLKINNGDNAFDSSIKGSLSKDEYKILSKIKQAGEYGFVYDAVNNEIYNGNQTTSNTTALSYIKLDLTDATADQYISFDTFVDTYNSNSYGYVSVSETLGNTGKMIYKSTGNSVIGSRFYTLTKGKVYYIYFGFIKGGGDINTYETFKVTSFGLFGERQATSDLQMYNDLTNYSFVKQENGSYKSNNAFKSDSAYPYAHSYMAFDLTNETDPISLVVNYDISCRAGYQYGYIYVSENEDLLTYANTDNAFKTDGQYSDQNTTITLTPGKVNYVHYVYYKSTTGWTLGDDAFTINYVLLSKGSKSSDLIPASTINKNNNDTYYFEKVSYDLNTWHDLSTKGNDATLYAIFYDETNHGLKFSSIGYGIVSNSSLDITDLEETVNIEYSTTSTGTTQVLYVGSNAERIAIGRYDNYFIVSNTWGGNVLFPLPAEYADGNKHSITVSYKSSTYKLYFDGTEITSVPGSNNNYFPYSSSNIYIGKDNFIGNIYGVKVFNKEITPEELNNTENLVLNLDNSDSLTPTDTTSYQSNNINVADSVAHSYLTYDLTNINEDKYLYVNTMISSHSSDFGNVQVTDSPDIPTSFSRGLRIAGEYDDVYSVFKLNKNKINYVHFTYQKDRWNNAGQDEFFIKEVKYFNTIDDAYSMSPSNYSKINTYYFEKPTYNQTVDTIELLKDVTINTSIVVPEEQEVILDLNGFTLTSEKNDYIIKNNGKLTITDSVFEEKHNANVDYVTEQARLYNEAKTRYLADKAEYEEYAGLCDGCSPSEEYLFDKSIITDFHYTGEQGEYNVTVPGKYKIEVWGAGGGSKDANHKGGYGGYSVGYINLEENDKLYINVGEHGHSDTVEGNASFTYNGGGRAGSSGGAGSGGGATHVAFAPGLLADLNSNRNDILIVAGGGGGYASYGCGSSLGGHGGGITGTPAEKGGTQETGGSGSIKGTFGAGAYNVNTNCSTPGAGSGYFGGSTDCNGCTAGGGSGYIGHSSLTDKAMYCYDCTESTEVDTKTISTTSYSSEAISEYAKQGDGFARISKVYTDEELEEIKSQFSKTYTVKDSPEFKDYLTGIDFDSSIDINTLTPDSDVSFNKVNDESHIGGITTTLASAILNEQYGILTLKNIAINVNVDSMIGIENRGTLLASDLTEINANNTSTIGIFNESNGSLTFNDSVINANGSSTIGLLNRSNTSLIDGVKVTTATTNGTGIRDESIDFVRYNNIDLSGAGLAFRMYSNAGDSSITNSNLKSTGNESFYLEGEGKQTKLTISNTNFNGRFYINRSPKEIVISNSTLSSVLNTIGNITLNSSSLNDITNRGMARINNSTITSTGTAINNQGNPEHGDAEQFIANMIINNSVINSTATSAANVISNSDRLNVHNSTINNINGTKSTAFNNASAAGATAYLTIDGNTIIDSSFGTAINNTGLLTLGSNENGIGEVYNYGYTGHQEEFVAPVSGTYKLETWGASGAESPHSYGDWRFAHGGFGGYASGTITLNAGDKLFIHVGGVGSEGVVYSTSYPAGGYNLISYYGSYNGGGSLSGNLGTRSYGGSGGGATDISLSNEDNTWSYDNGVATNTRSNSSYEQRIVVAGGGSGGGTGSTTKYGGYTGDSSTSQLGFGSSGGGGGYYGGTYGIGGSSYVSDTLTDIVMINGNNEMPNYDSAGIVRGNVGNGYAKITLIDTSKSNIVDNSPTISATNYGITGTGRVVYYDGTVSANKAFNSSIESVPENYDIYKSIDGDTENVVLIPNSDVRPVSPGEEEYVCKIGGTKYTTIQNAVDAANTGDTIELLVDINQQNMVTIPDGKNLTIDYNGHTVVSYNNETLFHITSTSASDSDPGITIKDSQRALLDNYGYGNTYIINDGKLSIKDFKYYDRGKQNSFVDNNGTLAIDTSDINFGYAGQYNGAAIKNNVNGIVSITNSDMSVYNASHTDSMNTIIINDGTASIKDTQLVYNKPYYRSWVGWSDTYFVKNNSTGIITLDNIPITVNNRDGYEGYHLVTNSGDCTIINNTSYNIETSDNTGIMRLTNNTFTGGTLSNSATGLTIINSGTYSNTFNISGTGRTIDDTDNLYSLIMEDGTINTTLNISSTGISNIKAGTISVNSGYAINNTGAGIITLGINDSSTAPKADTRPIISGATYGIYTNNPNAVINFYDGIVSGQTAYNLTVNDIETGYSLRRDYDSGSDREEKYLTNEPMFTNVTQSVNYATVAEFNNAINNGSINNDDEIIVYRNITISKNDPTITIPSGLNITFDINGKVIDKGNNLMFENNGTLTITDSITDSTGKIDSTSGNIVENNGTLNILKGTYISQRDSKETAIIMNTLGSTLNITDGNFTKYYDKLDELSQQDRGFGSIINNSGDVTITGGHYTINSSNRGGYWNRVANYIYTSNVFWNTSTGVINASNITADGFASVDIDADNKQYGSSISYNAEGQMFHNDGILNISNSVSTNSLIGDNTGTVVMEDVTMTNISYINNVWQSGMHKPIVNSGTFTIKGGDYTVAYQFAKNTGTLIITNDSLGTGTTVTRTSSNASCGFGCQTEDNYNDRLIFNKGTGNLEITNATILADSISTSSIVSNSSSGQVNVTNSTLKTNNYPTIINDTAGTINVNNSTLTTKAHNTINNNSTGTVNVYGDSTEIITDSGIGILNNSTGTVNVGKLKTEDASLSQTNPLVVGSTYGVSNTKGTFNFYDGILKGKTAAKSGSITNIEPNYSIIEPTDPVDDYYVAYLDRIYVVENANDSTKKYYSIADAFDDAIGGEEFKMIANYSTTIDIPTAEANNNITFDLNGYTITQGNSVLFTNNSNLTIVDSSTNKTGSIVVASGSKAFDNYGTLNLNAGNISTNSGILFVNNNTGATLNIRNHAKLDSSVSSTLIDNSGTTNIYNGAYLHTVDHNIIINRNILNVVDLNNDDDNSTSSEYDAPWIYCPDNISRGSYHPEDNYGRASIENIVGATTTIYGGIYNNGGTYDSGTPDVSAIIRNKGTAIIRNLENYSFILGYNSGTMDVRNSHFYNFINHALTNEGGTVGFYSVTIEVTATAGLGVSQTRILNWGQLNLDQVNVSMREVGNGSFIQDGSINIADCNIDFTTYENASVISGSSMNIADSTINSNHGISSSREILINNSTITSPDVAITSSGPLSIWNNSTISSSGNNAINTSGTLNILDTSRVVSTNGNGIYLDGNGTLNIGEIGGTPSVTDPYIEGSTYGVYRNTNTSKLNFYDGLVVGQTGPNAIYGGVTNVEGGYETTDIVDPDDNNRHHEFLVVSATSVAIAKVGTYTFSSNGSINSSQALQNAINFAIGDGTNVKVVDLVADVDLTVDEVSLTASSPVTVNLNGKTIISDSTYTIDSNINTNSGNLGGSISRLLADTFDITSNPKNIIIYELGDGSKLDTTKTYKLYRDSKILKLEKEESGRYRYQGETDTLVPIRGRLYINNLGKGLYRLESSDNKYIEFNIDSDGNISGNITENPNDRGSSSAIAESNAELILTIQTGIERHFYLLFILPVAFIIILLIIIKKRETN